MDQALKSAEAINAVFNCLGVPCVVHVDDLHGKFVAATSDIVEGTSLVEEVPIVSWPTAAGCASCASGFCFHCLRQRRAGEAQENISVTEGEEVRQELLQWSTCAACRSSFCSNACSKASDRVHMLLCASLDTLRSHLPHPQDHVVPLPSAPAPASSSLMVGAERIEQPITKEALARCVAWGLARIAATIEHQKLSHDLLQADYVACHDNTPHSLVRQLFVQAVEPFNRLITTPDGAEFVDVDTVQWMEAVRCALRERGRRMLLLAAGYSTPHAPSASPAPRAAGEDHQASGGGLWVDTLLDGFLSTSTLQTFLGQLTLNAHAINDYVICPGALSGADNMGEDRHIDVGQHPAVSRPLPSQPSRAVFRWFVKGAAVYALLSCVNHSCDPNAVVCSSEGNTHEIVLKTTRAIARGESICITYIPLHDGESGRSLSCAERRSKLEGYFFTCQCPRCVAEET